LKTLHLYLTKQVLVSLLMTVAVFTFVLLLGNVLKEILGLLVSGQVSLGLVLKAIALLVPYVMAYVLPFAILTAVVLVFGRFSADQELTAVRAGGLSLLSLVTPVLLLSLALSGICAWFNLSIAPRCRAAYKDIIFQLGTRSISNLITEDRFIDEIPGYILYIRKKDGDKLEDVRLYELENYQIKLRVSAKTGVIHYDSATHIMQFELFEVVTELRQDRDPVLGPDFVGPPPPEKPDWLTAQAGKYVTDPKDLTPFMKNERKPKLTEMTLSALWRERRELESAGIGVMPVRIQMHRQIAFSFACFAFTLIGIPLAIQAHRRETSIGVAIALGLVLMGLVLIYYAFFVAGEALGTKENLNPHLLMWVPNVLFQLIGAVLLRRADHG
jgi:lipopolysaccharide export system permease protein